MAATTPSGVVCQFEYLLISTLLGPYRHTASCSQGELPQKDRKDHTCLLADGNSIDRMNAIGGIIKDTGVLASPSVEKV